VRSHRRDVDALCGLEGLSIGPEFKFSASLYIAADFCICYSGTGSALSYTVYLGYLLFMQSTF